MLASWNWQSEDTRGLAATGLQPDWPGKLGSVWILVSVKDNSIDRDSYLTQLLGTSAKCLMLASEPIQERPREPQYTGSKGKLSCGVPYLEPQSCPYATSRIFLMLGMLNNLKMGCCNLCLNIAFPASIYSIQFPTSFVSHIDEMFTLLFT